MATITELHVGWSETASLPDYNNVKPSVSLTIHLSEHDDPDAVRQTYTALCKAHV